MYPQLTLPPSGVDVYLVAPFLLRAIRKVRLTPQELQSLATEEMAACSSNAAEAAEAAAEAKQQQQRRQGTAPQELLTAAAQHQVKLPNPLSLRMKGGAAAGAAGAPASASGPSLSSFEGSPAATSSSLGESAARVIDVFLCCGGKDMLALDWLPFVSRCLHFCLSTCVKRQQHAAAEQGRLTFSRDAVFSAAVHLSKQSTRDPVEHRRRQLLASVLAKAAAQNLNVSNNSNTAGEKQPLQQQQKKQQRQQRQQQTKQTERTVADALEFRVRQTHNHTRG